MKIEMADFENIHALAAGHVTHDRHGDGLNPGGSAYFAARVFKALGARSVLATAVGDDFIGVSDLWGVDVHGRIGEHTTVFTNSYFEDGEVHQLIEATAYPVTSDLLCEIEGKLDLIFLAPVFGEIDLSDWLEAIPYCGSTIVGLGLQGCVRGVDEPLKVGCPRQVVPKALRLDKEVFSRLDAVFMSENDIKFQAATGLLDVLIETVPWVTVTRGPKGCTVYHKGREENLGVFPATEVDPTGAGDVFAAASLLARAIGRSPVEAATFGAAASSIVVQGQGGDRLDDMHLAFQMC